ncbi:MAG: 4-hydroxythreonine-4-phosphate dehydrogenase PdxA [Oligoflexia bacterium]
MILLVTPGDPSGIGPEITLSALSKARLSKNTRVVCVGAAEPLERLGAKLRQISSLEEAASGVFSRHEILVIPSPRRHRTLRPGPALEGFQAGWAIQAATQWVLAGKADAIVTGPINKLRLQRGGFPFPGHTEMLASICSQQGKPLPVTMMLANERLRVSLATTHVSIRKLPTALSRKAVQQATAHTVAALRNWWGVLKPRIAVCGLNPHAGEDGLFGNEEARVISPALKALRRRFKSRAEIIGPLPADTLFANHIGAEPGKSFDAVVCMYHDQGLIPVKLIDFYNTVNVSLGLPILRTSVDHGVAYDLVGTGRARPDSMIAALELAQSLVKKRTASKRKTKDARA